MSPKNGNPNDDLQVGDVVEFEFAKQTIRAVVIEDRGRFGPERKHILRVRYEWPDDPPEVELPAEILKRVSPGAVS